MKLASEELFDELVTALISSLEDEYQNDILEGTTKESISTKERNDELSVEQQSEENNDFLPVLDIDF